MTRRDFLCQLGAISTTALLPQTACSFTPASQSKKLQFGIVADVHKDLMPDADSRLETFVVAAQEHEVDFVIQLGDFCFADNKNKPFMRIWNTFKGPRYHVLGNHDMDRNSKNEMLDFWEMPKTYYSFDRNGFHFIVLDANFLYEDGKFTDYERANFYVDQSIRTFIDNEQIEWFQADVAATSLPTIVFSHQSLWHYQAGVKNRLALQKIMESHSEKIVCCLNGHNHLDYHHIQNGIHYFEINSMSYQWMSAKYKTTKRFDEALYKKFNNLAHIAAYKDPLFAFATLDPEQRTMHIEGVRSQWVSPSPYDLGMPKGIEGTVSSAEISNRQIPY